MTLKEGVRIFGIRPELCIALYIADQVYAQHKLEMVITSVIEGKHSRGSLHYTGCAANLRTRHITKATAS